MFWFFMNVDIREINGEGNFIRGRDYIVVWNYEWLGWLSFLISIMCEINEYIFDEDGIENRDDELKCYMVLLNY